MWSRIARFIARRPTLVDWIIQTAQRTPYQHIHGPDGTLYMRRWWLLPRWALCVAPGTDRLEPKSWHRPAWRWMRWAPRLHHIVRPDSDRHLHDHPFDYRTIILRGLYVEEDITGQRLLRFRGETVAARAQNFHRITDVEDDGGVWTLFITGPRINGWGFLVDGHKVPWRKYLGEQL